MLINSLFHNSILKGNNLFPLMKHIVSLGETKCFDCYYTCETMVSFLRRCHLNKLRIYSALSEFPSALWCSQAEGASYALSCCVSQRAKFLYQGIMERLAFGDFSEASNIHSDFHSETKVIRAYPLPL